MNYDNVTFEEAIVILINAKRRYLEIIIPLKFSLNKKHLLC